MLEDEEHRAEHAQLWVAEAAGKVVAAVTLTFVGQPHSEIAQDGELEFRMLAVNPAIQGAGVGRSVVRKVVHHARQLPGIEAVSLTSATFMERAHSLYESLGFRRTPERDWYMPGEDVLLWAFSLVLDGYVCRNGGRAYRDLASDNAHRTNTPHDLALLTDRPVGPAQVAAICGRTKS